KGDVIIKTADRNGVVNNLATDPDSPALAALRRRGQFLMSGLLWAAAAGLLVVLSGYALILHHYSMALAERLRASFGIPRPLHGPDWFLLGALISGPVVCVILLAVLWNWYRGIWFRRLRETWP